MILYKLWFKVMILAKSSLIVDRWRYITSKPNK